MIRPDLKDWIIKALDNVDRDASLMRSVHFDEPIADKDGELWENPRVGSLYIVLRFGPEELSIENAIRAILGHDPMGFPKDTTAGDLQNKDSAENSTPPRRKREG